MKKVTRGIACVLLCALLTGLLSTGASAAPAPFSDVPSAHWAASYINRAAQAGLVQGVSKTSFGLGRPMTRAAFTLILCRFFSWEPETPASGSFTDNQDPSAWYYSAVETACDHGAITRQSAAFRPADAITREEMAVMLVRALGYTTIAGLEQGIACPFTDVESNAGYLTMAFYLGISSGTGGSAFSPDRAATREQAVAMLMRVYDRYVKKTPEKIGIAAGTEHLTSLKGFSAVAVAAASLNYTGSVKVERSMDAASAAALRSAAKAAGAKALLYVTGGITAVRGAAADTAAAIASAVQDGGYDGVLLDIPSLPAQQASALTGLVTALKTALGSGLLYVAAETPGSDGTVWGYDYPALSAKADRLILRTAACSKTINDFPTAPLEPLEEVYYALATLKRQGVNADRLTLWLTTTGSAWAGVSHTGSVPAESVETLLRSGSVSTYYSARYAACYLSRTAGSSRTVVWYNDGAAAAARVQMGAFFGAGSVCLSDLCSVADYGDYSLLAGLSG